MDSLKHLWDSSEAFYKRFDSYPPSTTGMLRVLHEEAYEVIEAALTDDPGVLADEAADLIVTIMGTLMARGVPLAELEAAMERIAAKNDAKTHETHHVNDVGKIARRQG